MQRVNAQHTTFSTRICTLSQPVPPLPADLSTLPAPAPSIAPGPGPIQTQSCSPDTTAATEAELITPQSSCRSENPHTRAESWVMPGSDARRSPDPPSQAPSHLELLNLQVRPLQLHLGKVLVQPVHLDRIQHRVDSEGALETEVSLMLGVHVLPQLKVLVKQALHQHGERGYGRPRPTTPPCHKQARQAPRKAAHEGWSHGPGSPRGAGSTCETLPGGSAP